MQLETLSNFYRKLLYKNKQHYIYGLYGRIAASAKSGFYLLAFEEAVSKQQQKH